MRSAGPVSAEPGLQPEGRVHLRHRLLREPQDREGEPGVELHELLDVRVLRGLGAERLERALVVLLPVADQADVVADAFGLGPLVEHLGQRRLGLVVALQGEVGHAQQEQDGQVARGQRPGLLQHLHRLLGLLLGHQDQAGVVEGLDVLGVERPARPSGGPAPRRTSGRRRPGWPGRRTRRPRTAGPPPGSRPARQQAGIRQAEVEDQHHRQEGAAPLHGAISRSGVGLGRHGAANVPRRGPNSPIFQAPGGKTLARGVSGG